MDEHASAMMDAQAVATIGASVAILTQIIKRSVPGDIDAHGPLIAAVLALLGVALWVYSAPVFPPARTDAWTIGAGWVSVFASAVGVYESVKMVTRTAPMRLPHRAPPPATVSTRIPDRTEPAA